MRNGLFLILLVSSAVAAERPIGRIAFGSCLHQEGPQPALEAAAAARPDVFLLIGDNVYADTRSEKTLRSVYARQAARPELTALRRLCPVFGTWDDHDYGENDAGGDFPAKKASQAAFLDFFEVPADSPRRRRAGVYHAVMFGPPDRRVQIILLDTRFFRSPLISAGLGAGYAPQSDPSATVLGGAQWAWLEETLREPARLRLIVSSIQVLADEHPFEKWGNFPRERERLFALLRRSRASGVIILSGDRHWSELTRRDGVLDYPLFDLTSSSLNRSRPADPEPEPNRGRVAVLQGADNFGLVTIDWDQPDPLLTLEVRTADGAVGFRAETALSRLQARKN